MNSNKKRIRVTSAKVYIFIILLAIFAPLMNFPKGSAIVWDPIEEISGDKRIEYQRYPAIAAENGRTYAIWADYDGKDYNIIFRQHDGAAWQTEEQLNPDDMNIDQWNPDIAVDGGIVHAVWHDSVDGDWDIMYRKNSGGVWGSIEELSVDISSETQYYPRVAADGGKVYVVWQDGGNGDWDICFKYHDGMDWSPVQEVSSDIGSEAQTLPRVAAGGGKAYVVWVDEGGGDKDILIRVFDGSSWGSILEVSQDTSHEEQDEPDIAYDAQDVHVVWQEFGTTDRDIFYRSWNGSSFSTIQEISIDSGIEFQKVPAITAQLGIVHVVWADKGDGDWDIVYRQFNGTAWMSTQEISADIATESQYNPDIATDNGIIHVIWEDPGDGDNDIFYRKGNETTPNDVFPPEIQSVLLDGLSTLIIPEGTLSVTLTATVDDSATGGSNIGGANYTWSAQNWSTSEPMTPDDALDSSIEGFHATLDTSSLGPGIYEFYVYGWDEVPNENIVGLHATLNVIPILHLEEGWNLVSFPQIVSNTSLGNVLGSIDGDYDSVLYYNVSDAKDPWKLHNVHKPSSMNDFGYLNNKMGFWVHITALGGTTLVLNGTLPSTSQYIHLYPGWNHVGYPSLTKKDRTTALNNLTFGTHVDSIWTYNTTTLQWEEIGETDYLEIGKGYWVYAQTECEWKVDS